MIIGDSRETIPQFKREDPNFYFDLAFIDGGHEYEVATADLKNMQSLCMTDSLVVMDDITPWLPWGKGPTRAWQEAVSCGMVIHDELLKDGRSVEIIEPPGSRSWAVGYYRYPLANS